MLRRLVPCLAAILSLSGAAAASASASIDVYPFPGAKYEMPADQIAFRGIPASQIPASMTVVGSRSGPHTGTIEADSDGNGGSFVPSTPFAQGETVTVTTGLDLTGAPTGTFSFTIASGIIIPGPSGLPFADNAKNGTMSFHSQPSLSPPALTITQNKAPASNGDIFVTPQYGPVQNGPMILSPTGKLIWFAPIPQSKDHLATDLRVQELNNQPVLTYWEGYGNNGAGQGDGYILNQNYQPIAVVKAANGLNIDLHEFMITNNGDAWFISAPQVHLPGYTRPIADSVVQEVDIKTGLVLFSWNALDHIPLAESQRFSNKLPGHIMDPYHLNSVSLMPDGSVLISSRNTWAMYDLNVDTGAINWTLGGKASSFKMGNGTATVFQHDAVAQPDGTITAFDDGAGPPRVHPFSRGVHIALNMQTMTASLVKEYDHNPGLSANFEGSTQILGNGDYFMGWGQQPYFSENTSSGSQDFSAHFNVSTTSYRAYRFPWNAQPLGTPAIGLTTGSDGTVTAYGSWNGATGVARWVALAGDSKTALTAAGSAGNNGFETGVTVHTGDPYYEVQALGPNGNVLSTSPVRGVSPHLAIYGATTFVSSSGGGGVPVGCFAPKPCKISTTVTDGGSTVAHTGSEMVGANQTAIVHFQLSGAENAKLNSSKHIGVTVRISDGQSGKTASVNSTMVVFSTSGDGPKKGSTGTGPFSLLGYTDFVASNGIGGILTHCQSAAPCHPKATLKVGTTVIATTGTESEGGHSAGYIQFKLNPTGQQMLSRAPGHQLATTVSFSGSGIASGGTISLVPFS